MIDLLRDMIVALEARVKALEDALAPTTPAEPAPGQTFTSDYDPTQTDTDADNDPPEAA